MFELIHFHRSIAFCYSSVCSSLQDSPQHKDTREPGNNRGGERERGRGGSKREGWGQRLSAPAWVLYAHHCRIILNTKIPGNQVTIEGGERKRGRGKGRGGRRVRVSMSSVCTSLQDNPQHKDTREPGNNRGGERGREREGGRGIEEGGMGSSQQTHSQQGDG